MGVLRAHQSPSAPDADKLQVYVDDPSYAVRGTPAHCQMQVAHCILVWLTLGVRLAFKKGQLGPSVNWIGASSTVLNLSLIHI